MTPTILVADDERVNLSLVVTLLKEESCRVVSAEDGLTAWELLEKRPEDYDAVILDRKMPHMTGMDVLAKMKTHETLKMVPVIFQTSMDKAEEIAEGLQAGVNYYLTKPLRKKIFLAVVKTALSGRLLYRSLWKGLRQVENPFNMTRIGYFELQTPEEAQMLSSLLASVCPRSNKVALGLWELLLNAVEHGNIGITYEEKAALLEKDEWETELKRRLALPENAPRKVVVQFESSDTEIRFLVRDQGPGFDWRSFMEFRPDRAFDPNGRGIHMARTLSFDRIEYIGSGNQVMAVIERKDEGLRVKG